MKKLFCYFLAGAVLMSSCSERMTGEAEELSSSSQPTTRQCGAMDVLQAQLAANPKLAERLASIEDHTRKFRASGLRGKPDKVVIPVVVNVLYSNESENISMEQIQSQIDVLNEDFNATNSDVSWTPDIFAGVVAGFDIEFVLTAINRKFSSKRSWPLNDAMKLSSRGGIDATDPENNLNMWVVNSLGAGRYLGYAQFPGGDPATDGVVIAHNFFGRVGKVSAPYNLGRTGTHEVGHWLNLRHIWGDAACGNDFVDDTPLHNTYNFGCPAYPHLSTCAGSPVEMTMNYMDYTDDACMFMFSAGQKERSLALFVAGGARETFVN